MPVQAELHRVVDRHRNIDVSFDKAFQQTVAMQKSYKPKFEYPEPVLYETKSVFASLIYGVTKILSFSWPSTKLKKICSNIIESKGENIGISQAEYDYALSCIDSSLVSNQSVELAAEIMCRLGQKLYRFNAESIEKLVKLSAGIRNGWFKSGINIRATANVTLALSYYLSTVSDDELRSFIEKYDRLTSNIVDLERLIQEKKDNNYAQLNPSTWVVQPIEAAVMVLFSGKAKVSGGLTNQELEKIKNILSEYAESENSPVVLSAMLALESHINSISREKRSDSNISSFNSVLRQFATNISLNAKVKSYAVYLQYLIASVTNEINLKNFIIDISELLFDDEFSSRASFWLVNIIMDLASEEISNIKSEAKIDLLKNILASIKKYNKSEVVVSNLMTAIGELFTKVTDFVSREKQENIKILRELDTQISLIDLSSEKSMAAKYFCLGVLPLRESHHNVLRQVILDLNKAKLAVNASYLLANTQYNYDDVEIIFSDAVNILYDVSNKSNSSSTVLHNLLIAIVKMLNERGARTLNQEDLGKLCALANKLGSKEHKELLLNIFVKIFDKNIIRIYGVLSKEVVLDYLSGYLNSDYLNEEFKASFVLKKYIKHIYDNPRLKLSEFGILNWLFYKELSLIKEGCHSFHPYWILEEISEGCNSQDSTHFQELYSVLVRKIASSQDDVAEIVTNILSNYSQKIENITNISIAPLVSILSKKNFIFQRLAGRVTHIIAQMLLNNASYETNQQTSEFINVVKLLLLNPSSNDKKLKQNCLFILGKISDRTYKFGTQFLLELLPLLNSNDYIDLTSEIYAKQLKLMQLDFKLENEKLPELIQSLRECFDKNNGNQNLYYALEKVQTLSPRGFLAKHNIHLENMRLAKVAGNYTNQISNEIRVCHDFDVNLIGGDHNETLRDNPPKNFHYYNDDPKGYGRRQETGIELIEDFHSIISASREVDTDFKNKSFDEQLEECVNSNPKGNKYRIREKLAQIIYLFSTISSKEINQTPRYAQLIAVLTLIFNGKHVEERNGCFVEVKTGEGKSFEICMFIVFSYLLNPHEKFNFDVVTITSNLAQRDAEAYKKIYAAFNLSVGCNHDPDYLSGEKQCYSKHIVYGELKEFEFDFLRHISEDLNTRGNREFQHVLVDEVDHLLIDEAENISMLSDSIKGMDALSPVLGILYCRFINILALAIEKEPKPISEQRLLEIFMAVDLSLSSFAEDLINNQYQHLVSIPQHLQSYAKTQLSTWLNSIYSAFLHFDYKKQYLIKESEHTQLSTDGFDNTFNTIVPVDHEFTGTLQFGSTISHGIQLALQFKHGLNTLPENLVTKFISHYSYIKQYPAEHLYGLSGTLGDERFSKRFSQLYAIKIIKNIPVYIDKQLEIRAIKYSKSSRWKEQVIVSIIDESNLGRAALLICEDVGTAQMFADAIQARTRNKVKQYIVASDQEENYVVKQSVDPGVIIVATLNASRGTHLNASPNLIESKGIHLCLSFLPSTSRSNEQTFNRVGRDGVPGSCQMIIDIDKTKVALGIVSEKLNAQEIIQKRNAQERESFDHKINIRIKIQHEKDKLFQEFLAFKSELTSSQDDVTGSLSNISRLFGVVDTNKFFRDVAKDSSVYISILSQAVLDEYNSYKHDALVEKWGLWLREHDMNVLKITGQPHLKSSVDGLREAFEAFKADAKAEYLADTIINNPIVWLQLGNCCVKKSYWLTFYPVYKSLLQIALHFYDKALSIDPKYTYMAYYNKVAVLLWLKQGNYVEKAQECISTLLAIIDDEHANGLINQKVHLIQMFEQFSKFTITADENQFYSHSLEQQLSNDTQALMAIQKSAKECQKLLKQSVCTVDLLNLKTKEISANLKITDAIRILSKSKKTKYEITIHDLKSRQDIASTHNLAELSLQDDMTVAISYSSDLLNNTENPLETLRQLLSINRPELLLDRSKQEEDQKKEAESEQEDKKESEEEKAKDQEESSSNQDEAENKHWVERGVNFISSSTSYLWTMANNAVDKPVEYVGKVYKNLIGYTEALEQIDAMPVTVVYRKMQNRLALNQLEKFKLVLSAYLSDNSDAEHSIANIIEIDQLELRSVINEVIKLINDIKKKDPEENISITFKNKSQAIVNIILATMTGDIDLKFAKLSRVQACALVDLPENFYQKASYTISGCNTAQAIKILGEVKDKADGYGFTQEPISQVLLNIDSNLFWQQQFYDNGYQFLIRDLHEHQPFQLRAMILLSVLAVSELSLAGVSLFYAPNTTAYLFSEGLVDLFRLGNTYWNRNFSLNSMIKTKMVSLGFSLCFGDLLASGHEACKVTKMTLVEKASAETSDDVMVVFLNATQQYGDVIKKAADILSQRAAIVGANAGNQVVQQAVTETVVGVTKSAIHSQVLHAVKSGGSKVFSLAGSGVSNLLANGSKELLTDAQRQHSFCLVKSFVNEFMTSVEWNEMLNKLFVIDAFCYGSQNILYQKVISKIELCILNLQTHMSVVPNFDKDMFLQFALKLQSYIIDIIDETCNPEVLICSHIIFHYKKTIGSDNQKKQLIQYLLDNKVLLENKNSINLSKLNQYDYDFNRSGQEFSDDSELDLKDFKNIYKEIIDTCFDYHYTFFGNESGNTFEDKQIKLKNHITKRLTDFSLDCSKTAIEVLGQTVCAVSKTGFIVAHSAAENIHNHHHHHHSDHGQHYNHPDVHHGHEAQQDDFVTHMKQTFTLSEEDLADITNEVLMGTVFSAKTAFLMKVEADIESDMLRLKVNTFLKIQPCMIASYEQNIASLNEIKRQLLLRLSLIISQSSQNYFLENLSLNQEINKDSLDKEAEISEVCDRLKDELYLLADDLLDVFNNGKQKQILTSRINELSNGKHKLSSSDISSIMDILGEYDNLYKEVIKMGNNYRELIPGIGDFLMEGYRSRNDGPLENMLRNKSISEGSYVFLNVFQSYFETHKMTVQALTETTQVVAETIPAVAAIIERQQEISADMFSKDKDLNKEIQQSIAQGAAKIMEQLDEAKKRYDEIAIRLDKLNDKKDNLSDRLDDISDSVENLEDEIAVLKDAKKEDEYTEVEKRLFSKLKSESKKQERYTDRYNDLTSEITQLMQDQQQYHLTKMADTIGNLMEANKGQFAILEVIIQAQTAQHQSMTDSINSFVVVIRDVFTQLENGRRDINESGKNFLQSALDTVRSWNGKKDGVMSSSNRLLADNTSAMFNGSHASADSKAPDATDKPAEKVTGDEKLTV